VHESKTRREERKEREREREARVEHSVNAKSDYSFHVQSGATVSTENMTKDPAALG